MVRGEEGGVKGYCGLLQGSKGQVGGTPQRGRVV